MAKPKGFTKASINDKLFEEIVKGIDKNATLKSWAPEIYKKESGYITDILDKNKNQDEKIAGVFPYEVEFSINESNNTVKQKIMIKSKPNSSEVIDSFGKIIPDSAKEFKRIYYDYAPKIELGSIEYREIESYRIKDEALRAITPDIYWSKIDPEHNIFAFVMEYLDQESVSHYDTINDIHLWKNDDILAVLDGLASFHARFYGRISDLPLSLRKYIDNLYKKRFMDAFPFFEACILRNQELGVCQTECKSVLDGILHNLPEICDILDTYPKTLVHNDSHIMNICLRKNPSPGKHKLCLYDWELCCTGVPQQDVALFLLFTLPQHTPISKWEFYIEQYYASFVKYLKNLLKKEGTVQRNQSDVSIPAFIDFQKAFDIAIMVVFMNTVLWGPAVVCAVYELPFQPRVHGNAVQYINHVWKKYNFK